MASLIPRRLYRLRARNLRLGVWRADVRGFVGVREKFGFRYLFTEFHYDNGPPLGTAWALEDVGVDAPEPLSLDEYLGTVCELCGGPVYHPGPPYPAPWAHQGGWKSHEARPKAVHNDALFQWLEAREEDAHADVP